MRYTPRILIIHRALAPYRIELFGHIMKRYDAELYLEYGQPLEQDFDQAWIRERIDFDYKVLSPGPSCLPNFRRELFQVLSKPYDLILCSEFNLLTAMLYLLRGRSARPKPRLVSICDDNMEVAEETLRDPSYWSKRWLLDHLDGVILCSNEVRELYRDICRGEVTKWHYLPIVQDEQYLRERVEQAREHTEALRQLYAIPSGRAVILYVGRLDRVKNLPRLLDAFKSLQRESLDLHLLMVGDGPMEGELRKQVTQLALEERVTLAGKQQGCELYAHYGLGEALILPSRDELFGATVAEAMALGLPVAVSQVAGSAELITSEQIGYRLNPLETTDIAEALKHLCELIGERRRTAEQSGVAGTVESLLPHTFSHYMSELDSYLDSLIAERYR